MIVDYDKPFINECGQRKFHLIIQNFHRKQEKWSSEAEYSAQLPCQKAYAKYAEWWLEIEEKL
ncbi:MAG: hypothetical protein LBK58_08715 [Prevotellaceae bacterium]|nr:hypothetical protein [Prevotellaceae bacterium]